MGLKFELLAYHYLRRVEMKMQEGDKVRNEKKTVDINRFLRFEMSFSNLQAMIEESAYQHAGFWELLKSEKASRKRLYEEGVRINEQLEGVKTEYESLNEVNSNNIHCMVLYANFMKVIVNSSEAYERSQEAIEAAKRSMAQSFKIQSDMEKEKYGDNAVSAVVVVSGERKDIGIIKHCTTKVSEVCGYTAHQLLGQNVNVLMPKFIGNMHDDVLRNYLELSQSQYDYVERVVPMMDNNNFLVLTRMLTKPLPNLLNGLELVGIFNAVIETSLNHPGEQPKYVLYRADTGQVQALSESCHKEFHYKINKIDEYHETSSELSFSTLFLGIREADLTEGARVKCSVLSKVTNTSDF